MRTDVKALIAALTSERNAIDRAIGSLRGISPEPEPAPRVAAPKTVRKVRKRPRAGFAIAPEKRAHIVSVMAAAKATGAPMLRTARELSRTTGVAFATIATGWTRWRGQTDQPEIVDPVNGNGAEPTPELVGAIQ